MSGEFVDMIEAKIAQKFKKQYAQLTPIMVLAFLHMRLAALKAADLEDLRGRLRDNSLSGSAISSRPATVCLRRLSDRLRRRRRARCR